MAGKKKIAKAEKKKVLKGSKKLGKSKLMLVPAV
jgi:hypothetical protein